MKLCLILFSLCLGFPGHYFKHAEAKLEAEGIVGGTDAKLGQIKYQVSLETEMDNICGGGIIGDQYVLTAAHCVIDWQGNFKVERLSVLAATLKANAKDDPKSVRVEVERIYVLNEYSPVNPQPEKLYRSTADLAVLKLKLKLGIDSNPLLEALKLPEPFDQSYFNETAVIAGFGDNWIYLYDDPVTGNKIEYGGGSNNTLRYAEARVIDNHECQQHFDAPILSTHLCAAMVQRDSDYEEGVCSGDSGSPLVYNGSTVIGVVSSSPLGCTEAVSPAVYTRVSSYLSFLYDVLNDNISSNIREALLRDFLSPINETIQMYVERRYK